MICAQRHVSKCFNTELASGSSTNYVKIPILENILEKPVGYVLGESKVKCVYHYNGCCNGHYNALSLKVTVPTFAAVGVLNVNFKKMKERKSLTDFDYCRFNNNESIVKAIIVQTPDLF